MASCKLSLLSFLAIFLSFSTISFSSEPLNAEVKALIAIKNALHDPHGALSNWDEDFVDPCSWAMITCSPQKLVISLEVPSQNLSGTLSASIANLTNLQQLFLQSNNISGQLPVELGLLTKLQTLDLSYNRFTGKVPETLGQLRSLRYLRLNSNNLSGAFPASLSKIPQLSFLDLSYNNLSGPVPQFPAKTFNIVGNPLICGNRTTDECSKTITTVSPPLLLQSSTQKNSKTKKLVIALAVGLAGCSLLLVLAVLLVLWWRRKQKNVCVLGRSEREEEGSSMANLGNLRRFTLRELQSATENFNSRNLLGKGGFGHVYKGRLSDGTVVAVKRLRDATSGGTGDSQFKTEVEMISLAIHRNLLRLLGYCATSGERLLIYPYMPNGSVAARLRGKPALDWDTRKRIALGAARGLLYLHEQCDPKIIHRDVKAANVLLDNDCEAVVGDFGLAKLLDHGDSHVTTAVRGTVGHIAPEYLSTGQSSDKTDVFGFGVLLLELITGQRSLEFGKSANQKGVVMLDWVRKVYQEKKLELLVDRDLGSNYDQIEVGEMVQVALLCTQYLPSNRPKMAEVVRMLEGDGLAEKWEASNRSKSQNDSQNPVINHQSSHSNTFFVIHGDDYVLNSSDEDGHSADFVEEMELSGPR